MQIAADTMDWIEFLDNTIRLKRKWIPQDIRTIWLTRWRFIKVKYFKGFTTTIYCSDTKVIKFVPEAWSMKTHIYVMIKFDFLTELLSFITSQRNSEGAAIIPYQKSATTKDTMNVLLFVRSWRLFQTRKMTNPFPVIVRIQRNQLKTQNQVSIEVLLGGCSGLFNCLLV